MLPKNFNEPMGAPAIFEKQIEIKKVLSVNGVRISVPGFWLKFTRIWCACIRLHR
ncbi:MAG: hypothetical protein P8X74_12030 [Reinekea sp.]